MGFNGWITIFIKYIFILVTGYILLSSETIIDYKTRKLLLPKYIK